MFETYDCPHCGHRHEIADARLSGETYLYTICVACEWPMIVEVDYVVDVVAVRAVTED